MNRRKSLLTRRLKVGEELPPLSEIARGSLIERQIRCGKPSCRCARGHAHGVWYLTVSFARGRTEQITVPAKLVPVVQRWVQNYERWWEAIEEISAINRNLLRQRWLDDDNQGEG
jgi:hypothetical protein